MLWWGSGEGAYAGLDPHTWILHTGVPHSTQASGACVSYSGYLSCCAWVCIQAHTAPEVEFKLLELVYLVILKFNLAFELVFKLGRLLDP